MGSENWRWVGLGSRVLLALVAATLIAIQVLKEFDKFTGPDWLPIWLAIAIAVITFADNASAAVRAALASSQAGEHIRIQKAMFGALSLVAKECGLQVEIMGASVFKVRNRVRLRRSRRFLERFQVLHRPPIFRFRLDDFPQASTVTWTSGKGAIGQAWKSRAYSHVNWSPIAKKHGKPTPIDEAKFAGLPEKTRAGFTYEEFIGIVGKYGEILAVPIMSDGGAKILGVIAIDRPYDVNEMRSLLNRTDIRAIVTGAAATISADL